MRSAFCNHISYHVFGPGNKDQCLFISPPCATAFLKLFVKSRGTELLLQRWLGNDNRKKDVKVEAAASAWAGAG